MAAATGPISLRAVCAEFNDAAGRLKALYGVAAGVPAAGAISMFALREKRASVPAVTAPPASADVDTTGGAQTRTLDLSAAVADVYGAPLTYAVGAPSDAASVTAASVTPAGGVLNYTTAANRFAAGVTIPVTVTNRFGRSAALTVPLRLLGAPPTAAPLGAMSLTGTGTGTRDLAAYFSDVSGTELTYALTANPNGSASISVRTLTVTGASRGSTYTVTVRATNGFGQSVSASLSVTETMLQRTVTLTSSRGLSQPAGSQNLFWFPAVTLPADYSSVVTWTLHTSYTKSDSLYGFAYVQQVISASQGTSAWTSGIPAGSVGPQYLGSGPARSGTYTNQFSWTGTTLPAGVTGGSPLHFGLTYYSGSSYSSCTLALTLTYT